MSLALANGLLLVLVILELAVIAWHKKEPIPWREVVFNLNSGHILLWVLRGVEIGGFHLVLTQFSWNLLDHWSYLGQWIFAFIAWDFCFYWLHRFHHKLKLLWAVHVVHHEGEHFSLSLGIRNSWYSSLTSLPFFIILALIGVPLEIFITTSSIHYFIQFYNHNHLVNKSGWLEKILITPSHHRVHHGKNPEYVDRNFGGTFVFWDQLFGTFQPEMAAVPVEFGTKDYVRSDNVVWANNLPFLKLFKRSSAPSKKKGPSYTPPSQYIAWGGLLLFGLLLYYIYQEGQWAMHAQWSFFGLVFLGTMANGGVSEGRYWGILLWCATYLMLAPTLIYIHEIFDPVLLVLAGGISLHSLGLLGYMLWQRKASPH